MNYRRLYDDAYVSWVWFHAVSLCRSFFSEDIYPIAVGMLDGSNDEAGFHGEEAQPRRRYYDDFTVATVTYAKDGRALDRHACCIPFFIHHGAFSVSIANPSVPFEGLAVHE